MYLINIKKSKFSDCMSCALLDAPSCILETNCEDDLSKVDIIICAENPGKDEVIEGRPLVGKSGKTFRKYFDKHIKGKCNYLITNVVLCQTLDKDGKTTNPSDDTIDRCKFNLLNIVDVCKPKLIFCLGSSPAKAFDIKKIKITNVRGQIFKWKDYDVLLTIHPSYVNRNRHKPIVEENFENDFIKAGQLIGVIHSDKNNVKINKNLPKGVKYYNIPSRFYTDEYRLVDVQYSNKRNQVLYIFRDKDNKKVLHWTDNNYYCYQANSIDNRLIVPYDKLDRLEIEYKERLSLESKKTYEGDVNIDNKHVIDYFIKNKADAPDKDLNIFYFDIETDTGGSKEFPKASEAKYPICLITSRYHGETITYVVNNGTEIDKRDDGVIVKSFNTEKEMLSGFLSNLHNSNPDIVTGWNCLVENEYIWLQDRIKKIKDISTSDYLSKYGQVLNHVNTGYKKGYELKLKTGYSLISSIDHIFPVYLKEKNKYFKPEKLIENKKDITIKNIIELNNENKYDIYFKIERHINKNKDYTYRDFLLENLDYFLSFDLFDISITDENIRDNLKNIKEVKEFIEVDDYWWGKDFYKRTHKWSYKKLHKYISKDDIINQIKSNNIQSFIIEKQRLDIDISNNIDTGDLQLLGLIYTDGFYSKYDECFSITNKDRKIVEYYYLDLIDKYRNKNINKKTTIESFIDKRDKLHVTRFSKFNKFGLLIPLIYDNKLTKDLNLEILSRLSFKQFCSFFSGLLDGDGSVYGQYLALSCFEQNGDDVKKIHKLLMWNNIISNCNKNLIKIHLYDYNKDFINLLNIKNNFRKTRLKNTQLKIFSNSTSNRAIKFIYDNHILVRLKDIKDCNKKYNMYDIETSSHYFICNGIKTHNCINFDLCYIFNRLPQLGLDQMTLSPFNDSFVDGEKDFASIVGYVVVDMCEIYKGFQLVKRENNKLGTIAQVELGENKLQLEESYSTIYQNDLNRYIEYNIVDVELLERIENKVKYIKLLNELRKICSGSFRGCRKTFGRLDCLIIRRLREKGFALRNTQDRDKEDFPGAYVKEPILGLHNWIVDFDFRSLYPTLILTYNIGVNTFLMKFEEMTYGYYLAYNTNDLPDKFNMVIDPLFKAEVVEYTKDQLLKEIQEKNLIHTVNGCFYKPHNEELSFYSEIVEYLLDSRKVFKDKMFEAEQDKNLKDMEFYDIRQKTFKILANALYGILGQTAFRCFNIDLATSITLPGQEAIKTSILNADKYLENIKKKQDSIVDIVVSKEHVYSDEMNIETPYIITGDTDSLFATFEKMIPANRDKDEAFKEITGYCNHVSNFLNKDIIIKMIQKHRVPIENNRLELKNELMCNRGLFVSKKHYAINVQYQEGKPVDKRIIMGLEIKRRDFSSYTKKCLSELIDLIFESEKISFKTINNFIKEKQNIFFDKFKNGDKTVAKPINFTKKLEEYKAYEKGSRFPESIEAMQNWNMLMYETFMVGVGGYLFKIKGIDNSKAPKDVIEKYNKLFLDTGRKLTAIAVPDEELRLPPYFIVDMKEAMRFAWEDRYTQLLDSIIQMSRRVNTF